MRDRLARRLAVVALIAAAGGYALGGASATPTSEPDAAALALRVSALEAQVAELQTSANDQASSIDDLAGAASAINCLAYSDFHAYRETIGPKGRKYWSLPIMLWNMSRPDCRPNPSKVWHPRNRRVARSVR